MIFNVLGSRGTERTVVMDKSKGEPVISVKTSSDSKERVCIFEIACSKHKILLFSQLPTSSTQARL